MATRRERPVLTLDVLDTTWINPHLVEVALGGPGFDAFECSPHTDRYTKLLFSQPADGDGEVTVIRRTYTIRRHDPVARQLAIQFVTHGDDGYAAPWAAEAGKGDQITMFGNSNGAYTPDPSADAHLFVGDAAAFPAIASALEVLPPGATAVAILEVDDDDHKVPLDTASNLDVRWVRRDGAVPGTRLVDEVRGADLPDGRVHAFVHGELAAIRALRPHLIDERQIPVEMLSISGYRRYGKDEDGFQAEKRSTR